MISPHDLQILSSTSLFAGFSEEALRVLCAALRPSVAELPRGRVLWRMGEQVTQAGIVLSGRVEAWHYTAAGQADLAAVHGAGGVFGDVLMSAQTVGSPVELRTAADSRVFFLSLASLLALCAAGGGEDCARLLENLLREVSEKYWRLLRPVFVHSGWAAEAGVLSLRAGRRGFPAPHFPGTDGPAARHESRGALAPAWPAPGRGASALGAGAFCDPSAGGAACDCGGWMI